MSATVIARFVGSCEEAGTGAPDCVTPRLDWAVSVVAAVRATNAKVDGRRMSKLSGTLRELRGTFDFACMTTRSDPIQLTTQLMSIDSTSGREGDVIAWLDGYLAERGWRTQRIPVSPGRDDLFATVVDAPLVTLSTHLDTVPPFIPPRVDGSKIHGRGACDAKGIAAAMICAAERLREANVPIAMLFVVGEEVTHDGAHAANEAFAAKQVPATSRVLVNGEPTESTLAVGTKGAIRVIVRTKGQAAHSAYPHLGHSATRDLVHLLVELDDATLPSDSLLGETTINIGGLSGGVADNVVAPAAEARLMIRLVTPPEEVQHT